jgi:hypothetical protein
MLDPRGRLFSDKMNSVPRVTTSRLVPLLRQGGAWDPERLSRLVER